MADTRHVVVGTAGHVDHGKTALVRALTGSDGDRLPEEKRRGITIELGYAHWVISRKLTASVVDVPGHERFVRTMVAGASGIDCVLLVVAADEGVMPQTREHLEVCELLGVEIGVVVLTKCDLAEGELGALAIDDVRAATRGTFLETAEIVTSSVKDNRGIAAIGPAVERACERGRTRAATGPAFLAIDRVFTRSGAGTVVTGTLVRGSLRVEDTVDVSSTARFVPVRLRVRRLEVHGRAVDEARAPTRVAVNLHGDERDSVCRGSVLSAPDSAVLTRDIVTRWEGGRPCIDRRTTMKLLVGTSAVEVAATPLDAAGRVVRMRSREAFTTFAGQRFVVRRSGAHGDETIGGGMVCDPRPPAKQVRPYFFAAPDVATRVRLLVEQARYAGITAKEVTLRSPHADPVAEALVEHVEVGGRYYSSEVTGEAKIAVAATVRAWREERPIAGGISAGEVMTRTPPRFRALVPVALAALVAEGTLEAEGALYRPSSATGSAATTELLERILEPYRVAGLAPPSDEVVRDQVALSPSAFREAIRELERASKLRLIGEFHYTPGALAALREAVAAHFATQPTLSPVQVKELLGITRRHAIPLLEWLDREYVTTRKGDSRVPGPSLRR
jgi:selenocysteine-specific elongation factor